MGLIKFTSLVSAGLIALGSPVYATGSGGGGGTNLNTTSESNAVAQAIVNHSSDLPFSLGGASVGAAECAEAIAFLGLIAKSSTDRLCRRAKTLMAFCTAGYLSPHECRAGAIEVMRQNGLDFAPRRTRQPTGTATPQVLSSGGTQEYSFSVHGGTVTCVVEHNRLVQIKRSPAVQSPLAQRVCQDRFSMAHRHATQPVKARATKVKKRKAHTHTHRAPAVHCKCEPARTPGFSGW